jgi:hypothetical protein
MRAIITRVAGSVLEESLRDKIGSETIRNIFPDLKMYWELVDFRTIVLL